jgi:hypothetical protein
MSKRFVSIYFAAIYIIVEFRNILNVQTMPVKYYLYFRVLF